MDRTEFERLRDLPNKVIRGDIRFVTRDATRPLLIAEVDLENDEGAPLKLNLRYNPRDGAKTINVHVPGVGAICRLDVDGHNHPPAGRQHKHAVQNHRCPDKNLPHAVGRPDLAGRSMRECFDEFCRIATISHHGQFFAPDEDG